MMIERKVWLDNIKGYIDFLSDPKAVHKAWVMCDYSDTSVTNYDELYEQIFDDLDADNLEPKMLASIEVEESRSAISEFLEAIRMFDRAQSADQNLKLMSSLFSSKEWEKVQLASERARRTINRFGVR